MPPKKIDYELLVRKALMSVVKDILLDVETNGFYKKQHLFITFSINHPGAIVSEILREDFSDEITIVLEHEFWDMKVGDYGFTVNLAFEHGDEEMFVPFSAIIIFNDPSEDFCLEFTPDLSDSPQNQKPAPKERKDGSNVVSLDLFRKGK